MLERIHFSELSELAERDKIIPGRLYADCHVRREAETLPLFTKEDAWTTVQPTQRAHRFVAQTGVKLMTRDQIHPLPSWWNGEKRGGDPFFSKGHPVFQMGYGVKLYGKGLTYRTRWRYCADAGMWNVQGVTYKNDLNYLLDIQGLRWYHGIIVTGVTGL